MYALIIVDPQNDFVTGSLKVEGAKDIFPFINSIADDYDKRIVTLDWHPEDHKSFATNNKKNIGEIANINGIEQMMWPIHCVENTFGAVPYKDLQVNIDKIIYKGTNKEYDSYSGFKDANGTETELNKYLKENKIESVDIVGLALDYCVKFTALDAKDYGYDMRVIQKGTAAVNNNEESIQKTINEIVNVI